MFLAAKIATGFVAVSHLWFLVLEMFLWTTAFGARTFKRPPEEMAATAKLAMNQGLYNGFLAAGLAWSLYTGSREVQLFFLGCVIVAGIFGAITVSRAIFFLQALPAIVAAALVWFSRPT
jgi:putative membrane protein